MEGNQLGYFDKVQLDEDGNHILNQSAMIAISQINPIGFSYAVQNGMMLGVTQFSKFGRNPDIDTNTDPEDIWSGGGLYTGFPTQVEELEILSSNVNDTDGGTGARTVEISLLLDGSFNEMSAVTVTLSGTTPVSLGAQTYSRASRVSVKTAGSANGNLGTITLRHKTTTANIFCGMPIGLNRTEVFAYTVPAGKTLYIPDFSIMMARANGAAGSANITIRTKGVNSNVWNAIRNLEITDSQNYEFRGPAHFIIPEKTDIKAVVETVTDNNTIVTGEADGFLFDNV